MNIVPFHFHKNHVAISNPDYIYLYEVPADAILQIECITFCDQDATNAQIRLQYTLNDELYTVYRDRDANNWQHLTAVMLLFIPSGAAVRVMMSGLTATQNYEVTITGWLLTGVEGAFIAIPS